MNLRATGEVPLWAGIVAQLAMVAAGIITYNETQSFALGVFAILAAAGVAYVGLQLLAIDDREEEDK